MKFTIRRSTLLNSISNFSSIVEGRPTIPILAYLRVEATAAGALKFVGTDLNTTLITETKDVAVEKPGVTCVPARRLNEIVRNLPEGEISFAHSGESLQIKCLKSNYRINTMHDDNFPELPEIGGFTPYIIRASLLSDFIRQTSYAITEEESRFTLAGAKFILNQDAAIMVTTDGHRLAYTERSLDGADAFKGKPELNALIPKKSLIELAKILKDTTEEKVEIREEYSQLYFTIGGSTLIAHKLSGTFPNYQQVIPKNNDKAAVIDGAILFKAVQRVSQMCNEKMVIGMELETGALTLTAKSAEEGEASEMIFIDYNGDPITFSFNWHYLRDFLSVLAGDEKDKAQGTGDQDEKDRKLEGKFSFEFYDATGQVLVRPAKEKTWFSVLMPMRF